VRLHTFSRRFIRCPFLDFRVIWVKFDSFNFFVYLIKLDHRKYEKMFVDHGPGDITSPPWGPASSRGIKTISSYLQLDCGTSSAQR